MDAVPQPLQTRISGRLSRRLPDSERSMQFHLNGFQAGDPDDHPPAPGLAPSAGGTLPREVDVLIVGCGPAGLTLAAQLSAFPSIHAVIVEQKPGPLVLGQADGIACRTVEMFEAFGFAEKIRREAYQVNETVFWKPDPANPRRIARQSRVQDVEDGLSHQPHLILNQARVHDAYLDLMRRSPRRLEPAYNWRFAGLQVDRTSGGTHPVNVTLEPAGGGAPVSVRARYVVGCDGARSGVRQALGHALVGDSANQTWGVMDVLAVTDFPDIRFKTLVQSAGEGSLLIIPREGGYMVRIYVELEKLNPDERITARTITIDSLVAAARRIFHPYTLDVKEVAWWSAYEIGQRVCDRFDDLPPGAAADSAPHVFIAGDACHTHSPKAGQGMNVSMQDAFNLGWKLAAVLTGRSPATLLRTYSEERQAIAKELIAFDREWASLLSRSAGGNADEVQRYFVQHGRYTAGTATRYRPSLLTAGNGAQDLASGFTIGMRFHSAPVIRLADARPMQLGEVLQADGRWRLILFADPSSGGEPGPRVTALMRSLAEDPHSPLRRHTPAGQDPDSVIDLRAVFQESHRDLRPETLPPLLLPTKGRHGLRDYEKAFCPDLTCGPDIFDLRGIDRMQGCMVVVRPDQYVSAVLALDDARGLTHFFERILNAAPAGHC
jgi:phenol 2-monooxygenase